MKLRQCLLITVINVVTNFKYKIISYKNTYEAVQNKAGNQPFLVP